MSTAVTAAIVYRSSSNIVWKKTAVSLALNVLNVEENAQCG